ncbi:DUF2141 domain-containing protein [Cyclobacterium plantarum]|uniref:DUF2141 domain-containing protein n=1 Tax=Cyclobacterium plantarum TaxID=2716263 RepID=A0ABX0H7P7_9BACT|nr:DUF2141 domain-containing protein [Cyclobacterium plantarum]NHE56374.1 DUF2141 domain-containing protein [Cyclobacterium plantarum]
MEKLMVFIFLAAFLKPEVPDSPLSITVYVTGQQKGLIQLLVFDSPEGFPDQPQKAIRREAVKIENGKAFFHFKDLKKGEYAISAFHDQDGDGKMRKNIFGIPKDPYGFSNDVRNPFSPPTFQSAAIQLPKDGLAISFTLL